MAVSPSVVFVFVAEHDFCAEAANHKAQVASQVLYESDYTSTKTEDILLAMSGDPRLRLLDESELLETPVSKLAVKAKLISSNCEHFRF